MYKGKQRGYATKKLKDAGLPMDIDLDSKNWRKARDTLGLDSIAATKLNDLDMVDWYLGKCGPLCCFGDYLDEGGHAILVSGIFWDTELLRIHDPWVLATKGEIDTMGLGIWYKRLSKRNYSVQLWW
jgi:hypothetical protein